MSVVLSCGMVGWFACVVLVSVLWRRYWVFSLFVGLVPLLCAFVCWCGSFRCGSVSYCGLIFGSGFGGFV